MSKKEQVKQDELDTINEALSRSEMFLINNQKKIWISVAIVCAIIGAIFAVQYLYLAPRSEKAETELYKGVRYFEMADYQTTLHGDSIDFIGMEALIDQYGNTNAGNLANAYAGLSTMQLGDFEKAIAFLKAFDGDDQVIAPAVVGAIGDCLVEMDRPEEAVVYFEKAAKQADNNLLTPLYLKKAGLAYEAAGNREAAAKAYRAIKTNYPQSAEAYDIDKYIERNTYLAQ